MQSMGKIIRLIVALLPLTLLGGTVTGGSGPGWSMNVPVAGGTDFTSDIDCIGAWIIAADTETEAKTDRCGGDNDATQQGTYVEEASPPANSPSGASGVDMSTGGNWMTIATAAAMEADEFSFGCWVNFSSVASNSNLYGKSGSDVFALQEVSGGGFRGASGGVDWNTGSGTNTSQWYHVWMVRNNSTADGLLYIDGALDDTTSTTTAPGTSGSSQNLGASNGIPSNEIAGSLYECAYLDRIVTADEVCQICKCGFADDTTSDRTCGACSMGAGSCG